MGFLHGEKVGKLQSYLEYKSEDKSIFKPIILGKDLNGFLMGWGIPQSTGDRLLVSYHKEQ